MLKATAKSRYDLRWKVTLGLEIDDNLFTKSTLQIFRAQLIIHDKVGKLFKASLDEARLKRLFGSRRKLKLAVDTTPIFGKGAVQDRTISTTDPEISAGHKSSANLIAGHKASVAVDSSGGSRRSFNYCWRRRLQTSHL